MVVFTAMKGLFVLLIVAASATTFFSETFDNGLSSGWVQSELKPTAKRGKLAASPNGAVMTQPDARFFQYSHLFPKFSNVSFLLPSRARCGGVRVCDVPRACLTSRSVGCVVDSFFCLLRHRRARDALCGRECAGNCEGTT